MHVFNITSMFVHADICFIACLLSIQHTESVVNFVSATSPTLAGAAKPFSPSGNIGTSSVARSPTLTSLASCSSHDHAGSSLSCTTSI